jgi:hypothetical protein
MTQQMTNRNRWLALIIVCLGSLMIVLDVTIVGVALPSIREDLGFSESSLAWHGVHLFGLPANRPDSARG